MAHQTMQETRTPTNALDEWTTGKVAVVPLVPSGTLVASPLEEIIIRRRPHRPLLVVAAVVWLISRVNVRPLGSVRTNIRTPTTAVILKAEFASVAMKFAVVFPTTIIHHPLRLTLPLPLLCHLLEVVAVAAAERLISRANARTLGSVRIKCTLIPMPTIAKTRRVEFASVAITKFAGASKDNHRNTL